MYKKTYDNWVNSSFITEEDRKELLSIRNNEKEIEERFYQNLKFGTGGMRGIIGIGTNRINKYMVERASLGFARMINKKTDDGRVVIAYDSRNFSKEFASAAADVFTSQGIEVELFDRPVPTPILSYAIGKRNASAGVVITASHNPKEYNGYKTYWSDGGQMVPSVAMELIDEIERIDDFEVLSTLTPDESLIHHIDEDFMNHYYDYCLEAARALKSPKNIKIVYTPIHGAAGVDTLKVLNMAGFSDVSVPERQLEPDGDFPTVKSPNPEDKAAFEMALEMAKDEFADIVLGTDPDGDRVGVFFRKGNYYETLTGNQIGALLTNYLMETLELPENPALVKTIVTSELGAIIASSRDVKVFDTLTGFKYIGEKIKEFGESGNYNFIFGYEESYGYLTGTKVRDKDAVLSSLLIALMAEYYLMKGKTLDKVLLDVEEKYGYFNDGLISRTYAGKEGSEKILFLMEEFRKGYPEAVRTIDYLNDDTGLPKENVLKFYLDDYSWFAVRPSGTEPKIKIYISIYSKNKEESKEKFENMYKSLSSMLD